MDINERYKKLNNYLKNKFGERTLKICIDGGFTCPNRDGTLSCSGCIFCSEKGSGELINYNESISKQVTDYFSSYRSLRANKFIAYFQNFSNTYDSISNLKKKYDAALIDDRIVGLEIATRPDCINFEVCELLKSYTDKYYVCVELGLQTANDDIGQILNRHYTTKQFIDAVELLNKYNIDVVVHVMIGLPNETEESIKETVELINSLNIQGIKIHSTYIVKNTVLADMYYKKQYTPISLEYYLEQLTYIITYISPDIVIHRISGDAPKDILIAPEWNTHKKWILNGFEKILKENNLYQGIYYKTK